MADRTAFQDVQVELFLRDMRITAFLATPLTTRLSDYMLSSGEELELVRATIRSLGGSTLELCSAMRLLKREVHFLTPMESPAQLADRRSIRFGITGPQLMRQRVLILSSAYLIYGELLAHSSQNELPQIGTLPRFFPVVSAQVEIQGDAVGSSDVYLVNRDNVVGLATHFRQTTQPA